MSPKSDDRELQLSQVCTSCRDRHVKCSGGPICQRCLTEGTTCVFRPSHRGRRKPPIPPSASTIAKPGSRLSRTCVACRARHLKCSGGPRCQRCDQDGEPCVFGPSRRGQRAQRQAPTASVDVHLSGPSSPVASEQFSDQESFQSFKFFLEKTSFALSNGFDRTFWKKLVPQVSQGQPAIKHLLMAVGSMHESLEKNYSVSPEDESRTPTQLSLKHYQRAIDLLNSGKAPLPSELAMFSCLLFIQFETINRHYESATKMWRIGLKILNDNRYSPSNQNTPVNQRIGPVFDLIALQSLAFIDSAFARPRPSPHQFDPKWWEPGPYTSNSEPISTMETARTSLHAIVQSGGEILDPVIRSPCPMFSDELSARTVIALKLWLTRFEAFLKDRQDFGIAAQKEALSLRIHYCVVYIMITTAHEHGEQRFDQYYSDFECIVSFALQFFSIQMNAKAPRDEDSDAERQGLNLGIIPALFFTTLRCRHPVLRRKAVDLLSNRDWAEGSWYSSAAARVANWVITAEEHGLDNPECFSDVPSAQRIKFLHVQYLVDPDAAASHGPQHVPTRSDLDSTIHESQEVLLRYIRSPWDATCRVQEARVNLASQQIVKTTELVACEETENVSSLSNALLRMNWNNEEECISSLERFSRSIEASVYLYTILPHPLWQAGQPLESERGRHAETTEKD